MKTISENWLATFTGLFFGEGCADIQRHHKKGKGEFFRPRLRMQLRADDKALLDEIQDKLGGTLNFTENDGQRSKPSYQWQLSNKEEVVWTCDLLLKSEWPSKKMAQIRLVREAAALRAGRLGHLTDGERLRLNELYEECQQIKRFE